MAEGERRAQGVIRFTPMAPDVFEPSAEGAGTRGGRSRLVARRVPRTDGAGVGSVLPPRLPPEALGEWGAPPVRAAARVPVAAPSAPSVVPPPVGGAPPPAGRGAPVGGSPPPAGGGAPVLRQLRPGRTLTGRAAGRRGETPAGRAGAPDSPGARNPRTGWQDDFLNGLRRAGAEAELLCLNGAVIHGRIRNFDTYALVVATADGDTLVFKHAIVSVRPALGAAGR